MVLKDIDKEYTALLQLKRMNTIFFYFLTLFLYSVLIDSDKAEAMEIPIIERENILSNIVDTYKEDKFGEPETKINQIREEIYKEVNKQVERLSLDNKIFSLNVPTGTGKTLTSLSFALKLRDRVEKEKGFTPRIIYSLPFLSIIDQNFSVFDDVLSKHYGANIPSNILLKHHHLSEIFYETVDDEFSTDKSQFLIEGWNSEIVVTSFIQLFHSLISNKNRSIRKFHNIVNSIVLLDEIQAIPHKYWYLLNRALTFLSKHFNIYFVIITATEPLIFDEATGEVRPLVENKQKYFEKFDRITLTLATNSGTTLEDFKKILLNDMSKRKDRDFLIVMNTIDSSKEIFRFLQNNLKDDSSEFFYLSTNIVPVERLERINRIKSTNRKRKIIVSTQLIEAGVDIDVDVIYRDFSPLDSINQVAGRCNRNYKEETKGEVNVYILKDDRTNRFFYNYIYDGFLIHKTKEVFNGRNKIEERSFLELNNEYFEKVRHTSSSDESNKILENLYKLAFKETGDFKLIKEDYEKVDIFVELNNEAKRIWDTFSAIMKEDDIKKRREKFLEIKKEFYSYVISITRKKVGSI
jgi:CRISPR-associated endonuclease/helicase Cas3